MTVKRAQFAKSLALLRPSAANYLTDAITLLVGRLNLEHCPLKILEKCSLLELLAGKVCRPATAFRLCACSIVFGASANLLGGAHRVKDARDDLRGPGAAGIVNRASLEQFGMGQDDPELIIEAVEQRPKVGLHRCDLNGIASRRRSDAGSRGRERVVGHACCPADTALPGVCRGASLGSRQRVSAKIRIDPPAVRTYSTLPAEIQL